MKGLNKIVSNAAIKYEKIVYKRLYICFVIAAIQFFIFGLGIPIFSYHLKIEQLNLYNIIAAFHPIFSETIYGWGIFISASTLLNIVLLCILWLINGSTVKLLAKEAQKPFYKEAFNIKGFAPTWGDIYSEFGGDFVAFQVMLKLEILDLETGEITKNAKKNLFKAIAHVGGFNKLTEKIKHIERKQGFEVPEDRLERLLNNDDIVHDIDGRDRSWNEIFTLFGANNKAFLLMRKLGLVTKEGGIGQTARTNLWVAVQHYGSLRDLVKSECNRRIEENEPTLTPEKIGSFINSTPEGLDIDSDNAVSAALALDDITNACYNKMKYMSIGEFARPLIGFNPAILKDIHKLPQNISQAYTFYTQNLDDKRVALYRTIEDYGGTLGAGIAGNVAGMAAGSMAGEVVGGTLSEIAGDVFGDMDLDFDPIVLLTQLSFAAIGAVVGGKLFSAIATAWKSRHIKKAQQAYLDALFDYYESAFTIKADNGKTYTECVDETIKQTNELFDKINERDAKLLDILYEKHDLNDLHPLSILSIYKFEKSLKALDKMRAETNRFYDQVMIDEGETDRSIIIKRASSLFFSHKIFAKHSGHLKPQIDLVVNSLKKLAEETKIYKKKYGENVRAA